MHDRSGGEEDIAAVPEVTDALVEHPTAGQSVRCIEGHGKEGHQDIRARQGHDEVVCRNPKFVMPVDAQDDENVAENRRADDEYEDETFKDQQQVIIPADRIVRAGAVGTFIVERVIVQRHHFVPSDDLH